MEYRLLITKDQWVTALISKPSLTLAPQVPIKMINPDFKSVMSPYFASIQKNKLSW